MVGFSPGALCLIIGVRPRRLVAGHVGEFVKGLPEKLGTGQAPMDPGVLAAAFRDGGNAHKGGHFVAALEAFSIGPHRHQEPGRQGGARAG